MRELPFSNRREQLNAHGVYELTSVESTDMLPILSLLINDTERNNQTLIVCTRSSDSPEIRLFVYGML